MIIACCTDLIFATKIRSTAEFIGVPFRPANSLEEVLDRINRVADGKLNEPVTGVLVDLELGETAMAVIQQVKALAPGVQVIAFGSHVAVDLLRTAKERGADTVMPRSRFTMELPELLQKHGGAEL